MKKLLVSVFTGLLLTSAMAQNQGHLVPVYNYPGPTQSNSVPVFYVLQPGVTNAQVSGQAAPGAAAGQTQQAGGQLMQAGLSAGMSATPVGMGAKMLTGGGVPNPAGFLGSFLKQKPSERNLAIKARQEAKQRALESRQQDWFSRSK